MDRRKFIKGMIGASAAVAGALAFPAKAEPLGADAIEGTKQEEMSSHTHTINHISAGSHTHSIKVPAFSSI